MTPDMEHITPLRDLSRHNFHGWILVDYRKADEVVNAVNAAVPGEGDPLDWHSWHSDTVYEVNISALTPTAISRVLGAVRAAVPTARLHTCYATGIVEIQYWREFTDAKG